MRSKKELRRVVPAKKTPRQPMHPERPPHPRRLFSFTESTMTTRRITISKNAPPHLRRAWYDDCIKALAFLLEDMLGDVETTPCGHCDNLQLKRQGSDFGTCPLRELTCCHRP